MSDSCKTSAEKGHEIHAKYSSVFLKFYFKDLT